MREEGQLGAREVSLRDRAPCIVQGYVDVLIVLSSGVTLIYLLVLHPGHPLKHAVDTLVIDFLDGVVRAHAAGQRVGGGSLRWLQR